MQHQSRALRRWVLPLTLKCLRWNPPSFTEVEQKAAAKSELMR